MPVTAGCRRSILRPLRYRPRCWTALRLTGVRSPRRSTLLQALVSSRSPDVTDRACWGGRRTIHARWPTGSVQARPAQSSMSLVARARSGCSTSSPQPSQRVTSSVAAAQRLGVPKEKWVYLCGHADMTEQPLLARPDLGRSRTAEMAVHEALSVAGVSAAEIATFDLYSCFPISVFDMCDHLGIGPQDSRGLTLTGGLPYFGGAGNNYAMHAIAETVGQMRCRPGDFGLVSAIGGVMSKCSIGVYTCQPEPWRRDRSREMQEEITSWPTETITYVAEGDATIETYSVHYDWPATTGVIVGRLDSDNSRFIATSEDGDLVALLAEGESIGEKVVVRALEYGNRVSLK